MNTAVRDIRFALTLLWKDRIFTVTALLTLTIAIGAHTAIFTLVHSVLLRPLPVPGSDEIVLISNQYPNAGVGNSTNSGVPDYFDRLRGVGALQEQALYRNDARTITIDGRAERVLGLAVTPSFFGLLQVDPAIGRAFTEDEGALGNERRIILSSGLWQQLFGGDPDAVGQDLDLNGTPFTVVGVMRPDFLFVTPETRYWIPLAFTDEERSDEARHSNSWISIGRLAQGATISQVQAEVDAINTANLERFPEFREILINAGFWTRVEPLAEMLVRDARNPLYLLWGGGALVLLIGGFNIANLALARSGRRAKELATRLALGAGNLRVTSQLVTEGLLIGICGSLGGLAFGAAALRGLGLASIDWIPRATEIRMDLSDVVLTLGSGLFVGLMIGVLPLFNVLKTDLTRVLREESRSSRGSPTTRILRNGLAVTQVAFAFVLLLGAGMLFESLGNLVEVDPGFEPDRVVTAAVALPTESYPEDTDLRAFISQATEATASLSGIEAVGSTTSIPFGGRYSDSVILAADYVMQPGESLISPRRQVVSPGYFEALGIELVSGRYFDERDVSTAGLTVIVDEQLASKFWPDRDALGRLMYFPTSSDLLAITDETEFITVVGIVENVRVEDMAGDGNTSGTYYFPFAQFPVRSVVFAFKTSHDDAASALPSIRQELALIDPTLPLFDVRTLSNRMDGSMTWRRAMTFLSIGFSVVALGLAAIGLYGVLAYLVTQRTHEIGIRIALGGEPRQISALILRQGAFLVGAGMTMGIGGAWALRQVLSAQAYGVSPTDPLVIISVVAILGAISVAACTLPALRATQVDPLRVLNE